jgi:uncharacterized protein (TIGR01777 family)
MNILITGGSGFVGSSLAKSLVQDNHHVIILDKVPPRIIHEHVSFVATDFSDVSIIKSAITSADVIVHLAGASIFGTWTPEYKKTIIASRIDSARMMYDIIAQSDNQLKAFVSASAVGYYGDTGDTLVDESSDSGSDFLAEVCRQWESAAYTFADRGVRVCTVRTAIVLGPGGGMMRQIIPLFRWMLGGVLGTGRQWFSWIHIDDLVAVYRTAIQDQTLVGAINATSPDPVTNREFTMALARQLHRPAIFRIPFWVLKFLLGEFARAITASSRVAPKVLVDKGFQFTFPTIIKALSSII